MSVPSVSIQNRHGVSMLIDKEDLKLLRQHKNGYWCFRMHGQGHAVIKGLGNDSDRLLSLHRLVLGSPVGGNVAHVNGNKLDNRKGNLKLCIDHGYEPKVARFGLSKFRGVSRNGKNWRAIFTNDGITTHLGTFTTATEAALAYDAKARQLGCGVRFLNFPDGVNDVSS